MSGEAELGAVTSQCWARSTPQATAFTLVTLKARQNRRLSVSHLFSEEQRDAGISLVLGLVARLHREGKKGGDIVLREFLVLFQIKMHFNECSDIPRQQ